MLQYCQYRILLLAWDTNIFMPKDESSHVPDNVIDEAKKEIEEFKRFCFMSKPGADLGGVMGVK